MPGCDYSPAVQHWARMYAQAPNDFSSSLSEAMPYLLLVLEQIEKHRLPGEFAFLPYVESNYTAIASTGDRAAGIWQLMPDTAREAGLRITDDYDGRLDVYASTVTAIGLLYEAGAQAACELRPEPPAVGAHAVSAQPADLTRLIAVHALTTGALPVSEDL